MNRSRFALLMIVLASLLTFSCSGEKWDRFWGGYYLQGDWTVSELDAAGEVLGTHVLFIEQTASSLQFFRNDRHIGYGRIFDDYIASDDLHGYGIDKIYIDSDDHMTSEVVIDYETVHHLEFDRIPS